MIQYGAGGASNAGTRNSIPVYLRYPIFTDGRTVGFVWLLNSQFSVTLMLQWNIQLFPQFGIQDQYPNVMMAPRANADMISGVILISRICKIVAEGVIFHPFVDNGIEEVFAVGTFDGRFLFPFRI